MTKPEEHSDIEKVFQDAFKESSATPPSGVFDQVIAQRKANSKAKSFKIVLASAILALLLLWYLYPSGNSTKQRLNNGDQDSSISIEDTAPTLDVITTEESTPQPESISENDNSSDAVENTDVNVSTTPSFTDESEPNLEEQSAAVIDSSALSPADNDALSSTETASSQPIKKDSATPKPAVAEERELSPEEALIKMSEDQQKDESSESLFHEKKKK